MWQRIRSLVRALTRRGDFEKGMREELQFHMEHYTDELMRAGDSPDEARRRAKIDFGVVNTVQEECRQARGLYWFDEMGREWRHALRLLFKTPGFTFTAIATLALCFGANVAILAVIDSVLLRPLPFPHSERLVTVFNTYPKAGVERDGASLTNYFERRGQIPALSSVAIYRYLIGVVGSDGFVKREEVTQVSADFFPTLEARIMRGRNFDETEMQLHNDSVAIITQAYWRQHFQSDANVLGRQLRVDGFAKTIIGVLPGSFRFLSSEAQIYLPLSSAPDQHAPQQRHSGGNVTQMIARLNPGFSIAQAQAQIDAQNTNLEADDPQAKFMADAGFRSLVVSLHDDHVAAIRPTILLLQAAGLLLLIIGSVNLANLLLVREGSRAKEVAVRRTLGAGSAHVVLTATLEICLLTVTGALGGLLLGAVGIQLLSVLGAAQLPLGAFIVLSGRVSGAVLVAGLLLGLALAIPTALFYLRDDLQTALKSETRNGTNGRSAQRIRHSLIVAEIALSFVLLAGAGLLGLSLKRAAAVSPGFQADQVLSGQISLVGNNYPSPSSGLAFTQRLVDKLDQQPGVLAAGVVNNVPFSGHNGKSAAHIKGYVLSPGESPRGLYSYGVAGDYFSAMGFSLQAGRFLNAQDSRRTDRVCVVDEDFARYYWPHESALGHRLWQGSDAGPENEAFTVVGVVKTAKQAGLTEQTGLGAVYYPYIYRPDHNLFVVMRAAGSPALLDLTLQKVVRQIDPELAVDDIQAMDTRIENSLLVRRSPALLAGLFSAIALLLTAIGIYGVLSFAVSQRRREIGVRMALGAQPGQIQRQFLSLALKLLLSGAVIGIIGAGLMGRAMQVLLFNVSYLDLPTLSACAFVVTIVSFAACLWPARRAARISPVVALADQ